jgi:hypothetical protein
VGLKLGSRFLAFAVIDSLVTLICLFAASVISLDELAARFIRKETLIAYLAA